MRVDPKIAALSEPARKAYAVACGTVHTTTQRGSAERSVLVAALTAYFAGDDNGTEQELSESQLKRVRRIFVRACVRAGLEGLPGCRQPWYEPLVPAAQAFWAGFTVRPGRATEPRPAKAAPAKAAKPSPPKRAAEANPRPAPPTPPAAASVEVPPALASVTPIRSTSLPAAAAMRLVIEGRREDQRAS